MIVLDPRYEITNNGYTCNGAFTSANCYGLFIKHPGKQATIVNYEPINNANILPADLEHILKDLNTYIDNNIELKQPILYNFNAPIECKLLIHESTGIKHDGVEYNPILHMSSDKFVVTWQWYIKCIGDTRDSCKASPRKITVLRPSREVITSDDEEWNYSKNKIHEALGASPQTIIIDLLLKKTCDLFDTLYQPQNKKKN
jgi:hypothetical protein